MAVVLLVAAIGADALGAHEPAFYLLLATVVLTAHAALAAYGRLVELPGSGSLGVERLHAALGVLALVLVVVAAAVRAPVLEAGTVPQVGLSAVVGSLALLVVQAALRLADR